MSEKRPSNLLVPPKGGVMRDFMNRIKLILRLIGDRRVNFFLKFLPIASLAYLIWPLDLAPGVALPVIGALDDAAILWLGSYLFVELCPPEVVREHVKQLSSNMDIVEGNDEVVDGETTDVTDKPQD
jgi:uncharacterized membrane protein YkvA (DUF1232 family)